MAVYKSRVHHVYMASDTKKVVSRLKPQPRHGTTYLRLYRKKAGLSLETLAERVGITHASLSRIERGLQPYNQDLLELLATELKTNPASLLMRDPNDPEGMWSIWDRAKPAERKLIVRLAKTILTGT